MNKNNPPTMKDVAMRVGVSIQTVSAVINNKPGITKETRERVLNAIDALGYRPYSVARSLRTHETHTLALVLSDISNPAFSSLASAAEDQAHSHGYSLMFYNTHDEAEREASYIQTITQRWIDGVLFVSTGDKMIAFQAFKKAGIPVVAIDRIPAEYEGPSVTLDNYTAGRMAAEHLYSLGHRRMAHIPGPDSLRLARERRDGFEAFLKEHDLQTYACPGIQGHWACSSGYDAMQKLLNCEAVPTAVFASSDRMAIGAMRAAVQAGLQVPRDISIMGLDDIEVSAYQNPPLTTLRQSFADLGTKAIQLLLDIITEKPIETTRVQISPELVIRESTTAPGNPHPRD